MFKGLICKRDPNEMPDVTSRIAQVVGDCMGKRWEYSHFHTSVTLKRWSSFLVSAARECCFLVLMVYWRTCEIQNSVPRPLAGACQGRPNRLSLTGCVNAGHAASHGSSARN